MPPALGLWAVCFQRAGPFQRSPPWVGQARPAGWGLTSGLAPAVECVGHFHFQDAVDGKLQGSVELVTPGQGTFAGGAAVSGSSSASMNVSTLRVSPNTWVAMLQERWGLRGRALLTPASHGVMTSQRVCATLRVSTVRGKSQGQGRAGTSALGKEAAEVLGAAPCGHGGQARPRGSGSD